MKDLIFIQSCPDDDYFIWQTNLWLESLKNIGKSDKAVSLIFTPQGRQFNTRWIELEQRYPESKFHYQKDVDGISRFISLYIPILRPYCLSKYFQLHPELKDKAIFYCDADTYFTENFNVDKYLDDDICYLSNTNSYINATYFDSKVKDVLPDKLEEYKKRDILDETCKLVGIDRKTASANNEHSGGAQYLLKNIDSEFWDKVIKDCLTIRTHLLNVNKEFFESESKGFQSWTSDMWSVLWNLWFRGYETKVVPEMEFAWSSDSIAKLDKVGILHNAGVVGRKLGNTPVFYKGDYHRARSPFSDPYLEELNKIESTLCNHYYLKELIKLKNKYNLQ